MRGLSANFWSAILGQALRKDWLGTACVFLECDVSPDLPDQKPTLNYADPSLKTRRGLLAICSWVALGLFIGMTISVALILFFSFFDGRN